EDLCSVILECHRLDRGIMPKGRTDRSPGGHIPEARCIPDSGNEALAAVAESDGDWRTALGKQVAHRVKLPVPGGQVDADRVGQLRVLRRSDLETAYEPGQPFSNVTLLGKPPGLV